MEDIFGITSASLSESRTYVVHSMENFSNVLLAASHEDFGKVTRDAPIILYVFGALFGVYFALGGTSVRVLFVESFPHGQEAEFMGLFKFFEKIFAWIPLVTFATVNEITSKAYGKPNLDLSMALALGPLFLVAILSLVLYSGEKAKAEIAPTLGKRRHTVTPAPSAP